MKGPFIFMPLLFSLLALLPIVESWEWSDFVAFGAETSVPKTLVQEEIVLMRVRDIKRYLTRNHGYSPDELAKVLDKKELIKSLVFEEEKIRSIKVAEIRRKAMLKAIFVSIVAVLVVFCWPMIRQGYEIAAVNFVVYTDKRRYEAGRCAELKSVAGMVGFTLMFIIDMLQTWLSASILLSWFIRRSKYFFPTPSLSVRPGQFLGKEIAESSAGSYGINIGPMLVTWVLRFLHRRLESWTGRALVKAQTSQRKAAREFETPEERATRRAARKEAKRAAREAEEARLAAASSASSSSAHLSSQMPPSQIQMDWMEPIPASEMPPTTISKTHVGFLQEIDEYSETIQLEFLETDVHNSGLHDLD